MAKTKFYLDCRKSTKGDGLLVIVVTHHGQSAYIPTGQRLFPNQWNGTEVVDHPNAKAINKYLLIRKSAVDNVVNSMSLAGELGRASASDIKNKYLESIGEEKVERKSRNFVTYYNIYMRTKKRDGTKSLYQYAMKMMENYEPNLATKTFDDLTKDWVLGFQTFLLEKHSVNTASIYLRCLRAVINEAIDDEITTNYPFRKVKIKSAATRDRSLSVEQLRQLFSAPCESWQQEYVDIFKLIFCLCGINIGDLSTLDAVHNGRIEYDRLKTGKHYSIKVEPEAKEIIDRYKGKTHLLSILDRYGSYRDYAHHMNDGLKKVGMNCPQGKKATGTALFPEISTYYARYSWATIAAELDIPKDTIAAALGHTKMDVTAIYIRADMKKKIDEANRKILNFVFFGLQD